MSPARKDPVPLAAAAAGELARATERQGRLARIAPPRPAACACNGWKVLFDRDGERAVARVCGCAERCQCERGWWFTVDAEGHRHTARCGACGLAADRADRWTRADIPAKFWTAWLDDVERPPPQSTTPKALAWRLRRWAETWQPGGPGLFIHGPKGVGKTHAVVGALRWILLNRVNGANRPFSMRYADLSTLWEALKAAFKQDDGPQGLVQRLLGPSILVLDEVGQARNTPWQVEQLSELVGRRYNAGGTTVFLSNHDPADIADRLDDAIAYGGARLVDRMAEMAALIEVTGKSRRTWTHFEPD